MTSTTDHAPDQGRLPGPLVDATELEAMLPPAEDGASDLGWSAAQRRDAQGAPATAIAGIARACGLPLSFVPAAAGGTLVDFPSTIATARVLARRDACVMPMTMFGVTATTCLLLHGDDAQVRQAVDVLSAGGSIAFALSEPDVGSDLLAGRVVLTRSQAGPWSLTGQKWLVGRSDAADLTYLVARTAARGPAAFSALLLAREALEGAWTEGDHSVGLTGVELGTLDLDGLPVDPAAQVGRVGEALEVSLKAMQVVRLLSTAASLGCADTALRTTVRALADRGALTGHPPATLGLATAAAAMLTLDLVSTVTARLLHVDPSGFTLPSAVAKWAAVQHTDIALRYCGDLQGSTSVLVAGGSLLPRLRRDVETIRYIDTSPGATVSLIAGQLASVLGTDGAVPTPWTREAAHLAFDLTGELPAYDPQRLDVATRHDVCLATVRGTCEDVRAALARSYAHDPLAELAHGLVGRLGEELEAVTSASATTSGGPGRLRLAEHTARLYVAALCLGVWWNNRHRAVFGQLPGSLTWFVPVLALSLDGDRAEPDALSPAAAVVVDLTVQQQMYTALPVPLADGRTATEEDSR